MEELGSVVNLRISVSKRLFPSFPRMRESGIRLLANTHLLPMDFGFPLAGMTVNIGNDGEYDDTP